jgi:DNA-binding HxlR family transcriptional regulator
VSSAERVDYFAAFFKAMADENRIKIVGLLAHEPHSVEELAMILGVTSATVSHHLTKLTQADLVTAHAYQYYSIYSLRLDVVRRMAEQMLREDAFRDAAPAHNLDRYSNQVLAQYFVRGKLTELPSQLRKREIVARHIANEFEPGKWHSERRVNEILRSFHPDGDVLRVELVRMRLLEQQGSKYRRLG